MVKFVDDEVVSTDGVVLAATVNILVVTVMDDDEGAWEVCIFCLDNRI